MTEWELQRALTDHWVPRGVQHRDEWLMLVAWEVMFPSWDINNAKHNWSEPSIDFIAIDGVGRLVAIELKVAVAGVEQAWRVLTQVTHRAICIARTAKPQLLQGAHRSCWSGSDGEVAPRPILPVWERHAEFYDLAAPLPTWSRGVRRIVAANRFSDGYSAIERDFGTDPAEAMATHIAERGGSISIRTRKDFDRLKALLPPREDELPTAVEHLQVHTLDALRR
jgi:hypothetical protein